MIDYCWILVESFYQGVIVFTEYPSEKLSVICTSFVFVGCFPTDGTNQNPVSLSSSWLAYASSKLVSHVQSGGQSDTEAALSFTASAYNVCKSNKQFLIL